MKTKKIIAFILIFTVLIGSGSMFTSTKLSASETEIIEDEIVYSLNQFTLEASVKDYEGNRGSVTIPNVIEDNGTYYNIVEIKDYAFRDKSILDVTFPNSLVRIGVEAFSNNGLTDIDIPDSVNIIDDSAFSHNHLSNVNLPNGLGFISYGVFYQNELSSIQLPDQLNHIGPYAFASNYLEDISIPNDVKIIDNNAFNDNQLKTVSLPNGIERIESEAFYNNQITNVDFPSSLRYIGAKAFLQNELNTLTIPEGITKIEEGSFQYNNLTSIEIPNTITEIGAYAFNLNQLTDITIPNSVTTIEAGAFSSNRLTHLEIPDSVTKIDGFAFEQNQITSIFIPNNITKMGAAVFDKNPLEIAYIPNIDLLSNRMDVFNQYNAFYGPTTYAVKLYALDHAHAQYKNTTKTNYELDEHSSQELSTDNVVMPLVKKYLTNEKKWIDPEIDESPIEINDATITWYKKAEATLKSGDVAIGTGASHTLLDVNDKDAGVYYALVDIESMNKQIQLNDITVSVLHNDPVQPNPVDENPNTTNTHTDKLFSSLKENSSTPGTGDSTQVASLLLILIGALGGILISKKRK